MGFVPLRTVLSGEREWRGSAARAYTIGKPGAARHTSFRNPPGSPPSRGTLISEVRRYADQVVVTGASNGFDRGTAQELTRRGRRAVTVLNLHPSYGTQFAEA
jgi:hypothetical protein